MTLKKAVTALGAAFMYLGIYLLWQVILVFAATFAISLVLGMESALSGEGAMQMMQAEFAEQVLDTVLKYTVHLTAASSVLTILTYAVIFKARRKNFFAEISLKRLSPATCAIMFILGAAMNIVMACLVSAIPFPQAWINEYNEAISAIVDTDILVSVIFTAFLAPICEETVMRGLVHTRLKRIMPMLAAMILSSWIFGMVHGVTIQILYASILGFILSWVFEKTGSLLAPMLFHIGFNSCGLVVGHFENMPSILLAVSVAVSLLGIIYIERNSKYKIELTMSKTDISVK